MPGRVVAAVRGGVPARAIVEAVDSFAVRHVWRRQQVRNMEALIILGTVTDDIKQ